MDCGGQARQQARRQHGCGVLRHRPLPAELVGSEGRLVHEVEGAGSGQLLGTPPPGVGLIAARGGVARIGWAQ